MMLGWKKKYEEVKNDLSFYIDESNKLRNELFIMTVERDSFYDKIYGRPIGPFGSLQQGLDNTGLLAQNAALEQRIVMLQAELNGARQGASTQFDKKEIKTLISLCHPDKHGGKESAVSITQKLLKMRGKR